MGRTDDIINVAGHRLSTGGMEEVLASHPAVAECAVIGVKDALKGEVPCGFVVLKAGVGAPADEIERELVGLVRDRIGPVAAFKLAITVARLPKTRSGKILRGTMKKIADGEPWSMPATIDDPAVLDEIGDGLKGRGLRREPPRRRPHTADCKETPIAPACGRLTLSSSSGRLSCFSLAKTESASILLLRAGRRGGVGAKAPSSAPAAPS